MTISLLKNHPFAVEAWFDASYVLTYAVPKAQVAHLIPPKLELDTYDDQWAFIAVAMVKTRYLRPASFPKWLGNDFFLIGYRLFVRYTNSKGKRLRGLYILKSSTDRKKMALLGSLFTRYNYDTIDIALAGTPDGLTISSKQGGLQVAMADGPTETVPLPPDSPFPDWKTARRYAGPLPFTFSWLAAEQKMLIVEGVREDWVPQPVNVLSARVDFLQQPSFANARLANAFVIQNIPYRWKRGVLD